jgi:hypothetical protein
VSPFLVVKLDTLLPFVYVAVVAELLVDHPRNCFVPNVNPFAVNALAVPYVCVLDAVVPEPPFALYTTVYVLAVHVYDDVVPVDPVR